MKHTTKSRYAFQGLAFRSPWIVVTLFLLAAALVLAACSAGSEETTTTTADATTTTKAPAANDDGMDGVVEIQILAFNDFHGSLQPPAGFGGSIMTESDPVDAGGAEYLATHIQQREATNPNTVTVTGGDMVGASPLLSGLFHDEPSIEALNAIGVDLSPVGNHEFDEGWEELLRLQEGGCHPVDGCLDGDDFTGADFSFLAANVIVEATGETLFPAYRILNFDGVDVAFIGIVTDETPSIVLPSAVAGLEFLDEVETVNALVPELTATGIEAIVVLMHEGGSQTGLYSACEDVGGPAAAIVEAFDDEVDVVIAGHTHQAFVCEIDGKLVTEAASNGRILTDIDLTVDRKTNEVVAKTATNYIVTRDVVPDPVQMALIAKYEPLSAPVANRVIGSVTTDITTLENAAGESALGDVTADEQLWNTAAADKGAAVVALMNPGGIRADLVYAEGAGEGDGNVTFGESFNVNPFAGNLITMTLTGAQIDAVLEQQFDNPASGQNRILQVSEGFAYEWSAGAPVGNKVDITSITIGGVPIDSAASYRVTVNSYLAIGGDNFSVLRDGTDLLTGPIDLDAFIAYFASESPVAPGPMNRITQIP